MFKPISKGWCETELDSGHFSSSSMDWFYGKHVGTFAFHPGEKNVAMKHSHVTVSTHIFKCAIISKFMLNNQRVYPVWATTNHVMTSFQDFGNKRGSDVSLQTISRPGSLAISGTDWWLEVPTIYKAYFSGLNFKEYPQKIWPKIWYVKLVPPF